MTAYVLANVAVHDMDRYQRYREKVLPTIEAHGGRFLVRAGRTEVVEGTWHPARVVVLEFPDMATARRWYDSPGYQAIVGDRIAATTSNLVFVEGV
jgi:uncharacterized protein (DUF1330 family)